MLIHQRSEPLVVVAFKKMNKLMDNDILQALFGLLCEFQIEPDAPSFDIAASPLRLHFLYAPLRDLDLETRLPFF